MKKTIAAILILLISFSIVPSVLADGAIIRPDRLDYLDENGQTAAINYENGMQKMVISVNFDMGSETRAVWIFPVPAKPEDVVIDILKDFPRFYGYDVVEGAESDIDSIITFASYTQIYPLMFLPFYYMGGLPTSRESSGAGEIISGVSSVVIYEHLEKEGITTEIITSDNAETFYNYLRLKGLNIQAGSIPAIDEYVGEDYTFVVSWVAPIENKPIEESSAYYGRQPGVAITFPTDKIYFPLVPTSVYGSKTIPITLYVLGYVEPELYSQIASYTETNYYVQNFYYNAYGLEEFYGDSQSEDYTKIEIEAPSKYFTKDLWITEGAPAKVGYASLIYSAISAHPIISGFLLLAIISSLAGAATGFILFRDWKKYAKIGLANIFTIIGLIIAIALTPTRKIEEGLKRRLKKEGLFVITADFSRKVTFVVLYSISFLIIGAIVGFVLKLPMMF